MTSEGHAVPHTNSSIYFLHFGLLRATRKTHPRAHQSIWDNYIITAQKYYNFTTLSIWVVDTYMCV